MIRFVLDGYLYTNERVRTFDVSLYEIFWITFEDMRKFITYTFSVCDGVCVCVVKCGISIRVKDVVACAVSLYRHTY